MDPFTIAMLVNTGANLFGSIMGQGAAEQASENNSQIADWQMRDQATQRLLQLALQQRAQNEVKLGSTDAQGTRTYFEPGVGQVTQLGAAPKAALAQANANQSYDLGPGEQVRRAMREREAAAAGRESNYADRLFGDMTRTVTPDARDTRNIGLATGSTARSAGARDMMEANALQMNRRGDSGFGDALAKMSTNAGQAYQMDKATIGNPQPQRDLSPGATNLLGAMRARTSAGAGSAQMPQINVPQGMGTGGPISAGGAITPPPMMSPDYGPANMISQLGTDISSGIMGYQQNQQWSKMLDAMMARQGPGSVTNTYLGGPNSANARMNRGVGDYLSTH